MFCVTTKEKKSYFCETSNQQKNETLVENNFYSLLLFCLLITDVL